MRKQEMSTTDYKSMLENGEKEQNPENSRQEASSLRSANQPLIDRSYEYKIDKKVELQKSPSPKTVLNKVLIMMGVVVLLCVMSKVIF